MNPFKSFINFIKEHPWETGAVVVTGLLAASLGNANRLAKIANFQSDELDRANRHFDRIAEALVNGWELVLSEDAPNFIDIIMPDGDGEAIALKAAK